MATPGKVTKKQRKRQVQAKTSLNSPYSSGWSPLPQEDMQAIMSALRCTLAAAALAKREVRVPRRWGKRKRKKPSGRDDSVEQVKPDSVDQFKPVPQEDTEARVAAQEKGGWTNASARRQLAIGVNEVTKALERNALRLVLVCKSAKPPHVTGHLLELSGTRGVPACQVPRLSAGVAEALGLKSVLALGFRRNHGDGGQAQAEEGTFFFSDAVDRIIPRVPRLRVAWVTGAELRDADARPADEVKGEVGGEVKGHKRKIEDVSPEPVESDPCAFQPLKVKKIIPNPSKIRKPKIKKESLK